jgi:hypothetical protein
MLTGVIVKVVLEKPRVRAGFDAGINKLPEPNYQVGEATIGSVPDLKAP